MRWFRQTIPPSAPTLALPLPAIQDTQKTVDEIRERTYEDVRDRVDKCLDAFCKDLGLLPKDVRHRLLDYEAEKKVWTKMDMKTIYRLHNDVDKLALMVYLDTRMTDEEQQMVDAMSYDELVDFCLAENANKLSKFFREKEQMSRAELAARVKFELRLSAAEIKDRGSYANMARYWCKVRPEAFNAGSRMDLMRLYKD